MHATSLLYAILVLYSIRPITSELHLRYRSHRTVSTISVCTFPNSSEMLLEEIRSDVTSLIASIAST